MDKYERQRLQILRDNGAVLHSTNRHEKWRLPGDKTFVCSSTPSSWRASRMQLADLRRVLAGQPRTPQLPVLAEAKPHAPTAKKTRTRVANNPPRVDGAYTMPSLSGGPQTHIPKERQEEFVSVHDALDAVDKTPSYWALDACGRIRVLSKLFGSLTGSMRIITAAPVTLPIHETIITSLSPLTCSDDIRDMVVMMSRVVQKSVQYWQQPCRDRRRGGEVVALPCLEFTDLDGEKWVIETSARGIFFGKEKTFIAPSFMDIGGLMWGDVLDIPEFDLNRGRSRTGLESPDDSPEDEVNELTCLMYLFIDANKFKGNRVRFETCSLWTDHRAIRAVVRDCIEVGRRLGGLAV